MHDNCCFKLDYYHHFMDSCLPYHEFYQRERELTVNRRTILPLKRFVICQEDTEEEIDTKQSQRWRSTIFTIFKLIVSVSLVNFNF
uniref:Uncharacterized protein n=1 Tax=Helianthus annuus TaxID=4232 RepID=A0A251U426_HELAN